MNNSTSPAEARSPPRHDGVSITYFEIARRAAAVVAAHLDVAAAARGGPVIVLLTGDPAWEAYYAGTSVSPSTLTLHHAILHRALWKAVKDRLSCLSTSPPTSRRSHAAIMTETRHGSAWTADEARRSWWPRDRPATAGGVLCAGAR